MSWPSPVMGLYYRLILPSCCDMPVSVRGVCRATRARHSVALFITPGRRARVVLLGVLWQLCYSDGITQLLRHAGGARRGPRRAWLARRTAVCRGVAHARLGLRRALFLVCRGSWVRKYKYDYVQCCNTKIIHIHGKLMYNRESWSNQI